VTDQDGTVIGSTVSGSVAKTITKQSTYTISCKNVTGATVAQTVVVNITGSIITY
jgi:hypothetical protein